jgi:peptide-methionine (S)-S-oxide reductase
MRNPNGLFSNRPGSVVAPVAGVGMLAIAGLGAFLGIGLAAEKAVVIPPPSIDERPSGQLEKAVFAGGCFWGVQGVFQHVDGVSSAVSGYAGGDKSTADYSRVGAGGSGHAESVEVTFNPARISYGKLLQVFFSVAHNPTQLNYQGPDKGTQYRSAIFPQNAEQQKVAAAYIAQLDATRLFGREIVTTLESAKPFYPAEDYHQDYLTLHPDQPYIVYNDLPKIESLKRLFPDLYREKPVLVMQAKS